MHVLGEAFDQRLVHEVHGYVAPLICGGPVVAVGGEGVAASADSVRLEEIRYRRIGPDLHFTGIVGEGNAGAPGGESVGVTSVAAA